MTHDVIEESEKKEKSAPPAHREHTVFRRFSTSAIIGIVLLIVLIHVGFSMSYLRFFPTFEDYFLEGYGTVRFTLVKHLHGMVMMGWILMLLAQSIFIRNRKMNLHRVIGRASYVLAPLVVLSVFMITKEVYHEVLEIFGESEAVGLIALTFPTMIFFSVLYFLAIRYRHRHALHMRFMISTAFLFIAPALDRTLIYLFDLPGFDVGSIGVLLITGTVAAVDSAKTKRISPFALVFGFFVLHTMLWHARGTEFWQPIGRAIASLF
jgi:hypothetical protein